VAAADLQDGLPTVLSLPVAAPPLAFTPAVLHGVWALSTLPPPHDEAANQVREAGLNGLARRVADEARSLGRLVRWAA